MSPDPSTHPSVQRVRATLSTLGAGGEVRVLTDSARTAVQAAEALGVAVGQIVKSLVFSTDARPLLVLAAGDHQVDVALLGSLVGTAQVARADAEFVRTHTGFAIGGVAPVGHPHPLRTLVDTDLAAYPVVWAAAGHPHAVFPTTYAELLRLTGGTPADVARR
ncbi:MAG: YbaK/EbsC family protein [Actinomycetes bacterium]